jgi:hypothetical protein
MERWRCKALRCALRTHSFYYINAYLHCGTAAMTYRNCKFARLVPNISPSAS